MRYRALALVGITLGTASCRGCGWTSGEKTYETVHGKYELSLIRKTHWTGGRIGGPVSNFFVRIATDPPIDEPLGDCTHADMTEDKDGKLVAFRCQGSNDKRWDVVRLRGGDRHLRECNAPVGTSDKPDWSKLESVRASTSRIFECPAPSDYYRMRELAHAVIEDEGSAIAGDYVGALAERGDAFGGKSETTGNIDAWDEAFGVMDDSARAAALAKLCPTLARADGQGVPAAYVRAVRHCAVLDGTGAMPMLRRLLADTTPHEAGYDWNTQLFALLWSGLLAVKQNPNEAGLALCEVASREVDAATRPSPGVEWNGQTALWRMSILAELIGQSKTKCPALSAWFTPCTSGIDCDGGLCSDPELAQDIAGWDDALDAGRRADPKMPTADRALLRALYAAGPLPKSVTIPNRRRHYTLPDASALPDCSEPALDAGAECQTSLSPLSLCSASPSSDVLSEWNCTLRIDDAHQRVETARHACTAAGQKCGDHVCCGDLECLAGVCSARPPPDAGAD